MSIFRLSFWITLLVAAGAAANGQDELDTKLVPKSSAERSVLEVIKSPDLSVVHLWAPWCSNCQAELKNGGWLKMVKDNPRVKFYFVSVCYLRYALNYGEVRFDVLQQFLEDSKSEWSHKGEPKLPE